MGVFNRVKDIVAANINALLDKAEDPSKMLRLMIQEMEDTIINLKSTCTAGLAETKTVSRELKEAESKSEQWSKRAILALEKGREDLAREALVEKRDWNDKKVELKHHYDILSENVDHARDDIIQLEKKLISVKSKYKELVTRSKVAEGTHRANSYKSYNKIDEMERQVDKMEAQFDMDSMSSKSLEDEFSDLENSNSINVELEELKKQMKRGE